MDRTVSRPDLGYLRRRPHREAVDRTVSRPDLGYLRRRPHRDDQRRAASTPEPAPTAPTAPTGGLSLGQKKAPASAAPTPKSARRLPTVRVRGRTFLKPELPAVTLDRRQSAVGSLAFDVAPRGRLNGVWELTDGTAGTVSERGGITVSPQFGRRSLVTLRDGRLLLGLRHVHQLRRLLVVLTDLDPQGATSTTVASLYDGATFESAHESYAPALVALAIYQVNGQLVVRREGFDFPSLPEAAAAYGFATHWTPPLSR